MNRQRAIVDTSVVFRHDLERSRTIYAGDVVDFDEVLLPAAGDQPAHTLGEQLAPAHFVPVVDVVPAGAPFVKRKGRTGDEPAAAPAEEQS
jgi:hypothetical protein